MAQMSRRLSVGYGWPPLLVAAALLAFESFRAWGDAARWLLLLLTLVFLGSAAMAGLRQLREFRALQIIDAGVAVIVLAGGGFLVAGDSVAMSATQAMLVFWAPVIVAWWSVVYRDQIARLLIYWFLLYGSLLFAYADIPGRTFQEFVALGLVELLAIRFGMIWVERSNERVLARGGLRNGTVDAVTGFSTPPTFEVELAMMAAMANRYQTPFCLLGCEIDGFDRYVERFGVTLGNDLLRSAAWMISDCIRDSDTAGRWDGNRFLVILASTRKGDAVPVLEKLGEAALRVVAIDRGPVTLRLAAEEYAFGDDPMVLVERLEQALQADQTGAS